VRADEALAIGLVNRVVPADQVLDSALELAGELARGAVVAQALAKESVDSGLATTLDEGLAIEQRAFLAACATEDAQRGIASFREHGPGKATFVGR
jgi:enoyl-CoA hydratase/carnithine racemase